MFELSADGKFYAAKHNVAGMISEDMLMRLGAEASEGYADDLESMSDWAELVDFGFDLIKQETGPRSEPWEGAANFKSPELTKAALNFSDRAAPELLRGYNLVKIKVIGSDSGGTKEKRGARTAEFQNWQLNIDMPEWREEHEKLIYSLPYSGTAFKKTFFDPQLGRNVSRLITYPNFAVSQDTLSLARLRRFSELHQFSKNEVLEKQRHGFWLDVPLEGGEEGKDITFIEQDCFFDLDEDGYKEPYTVVFQENSGVVVRVSPRFERADIVFKDDALTNVVRIKAQENITKYGFLYDPQGGFLDVGYIHLLSALVSGINTTTNQLVDAGTLANRQSGWLAKSFRGRMGDSSFKPGEWKQTGINAQDLQQGILPLPIKEPSPTLLTLMQFMIANAQDLASSTDSSVALGSNAPVGTTLALMEEKAQGVSSIVSRLYRAMSSEFRKLFMLNAKYADPNQYKTVLDNEEADFEADFNITNLDITPVASPEIATKTQRIVMGQVELSQIQNVLQAGGDPKPLIKSFFSAIGSELYDEVFSDKTPEEALQDLLAENPGLMELITEEQGRLDLIAASQVDASERLQARADAELAYKSARSDTQSELDEAKIIKVLEEAKKLVALNKT